MRCLHTTYRLLHDSDITHPTPLLVCLDERLDVCRRQRPRPGHHLARRPVPALPMAVGNHHALVWCEARLLPARSLLQVWVKVQLLWEALGSPPGGMHAPIRPRISL